MKRISLGYGHEEIEFEYDAEVLEVLQPNPPKTAMSDEELKEALRSPVESPRLADLARGKRSALIVVSDATRVARADIILPHLLEELQAGGIGSRQVRVVIATGNHRSATPEEINSLIGSELTASLDVLQHDSKDKQRLEYYGRTSRGIKVWLNRLLREHELVITISTVNAHYFAGFTGGRKSIIPGMAGYETIVSNHLLSIDFQNGRLAKGVEPGRLEGNPVHEDLMEGVAMAPPSFAVNTILTSDKGIGALLAGHWISAHRKACDLFLQYHGVRIKERRPLVIASCGGHPKDIDLIQSHKTIQFTARALQPGGTLILMARCPDGYGNPDFADFFPIKDRESFLRRLKEKQPPNAQTALAFHAKTQEFRIILVSELNPESVEEIFISPAASLEEATSMLDKKITKGYIIPDGAVTLPFTD